MASLPDAWLVAPAAVIGDRAPAAIGDRAPAAVIADRAPAAIGDRAPPAAIGDRVPPADGPRGEARMQASAQLGGAVAGPPRPRIGTVASARQTDLSALYAAHAPAIHRFLCDLLGDRAAAADATQETFVRAFRRIDTLAAADRPAPWLFGIARNVSLEVLKARRRSRRVLDEGPIEPWEERVESAAPCSPEDELIGREAIDIVRCTLARLSEDRRAVLLLRLDHGLSYEEIAATLAWSVPKVKVELHRARQILRAELQHHERDQR